MPVGACDHLRLALTAINLAAPAGQGRQPKQASVNFPLVALACSALFWETVDELHLVQVLGKLALHVLGRIKINLLILRQRFLRHYLEKMAYY